MPAKIVDKDDPIGDKATRADDVVIVALGEVCTGSSAGHKVDGEDATLIGDFEGAVRCVVRALSLAARKNGLSGCDASTVTMRYSIKFRTSALDINMMNMTWRANAVPNLE